MSCIKRPLTPVLKWEIFAIISPSNYDVHLSSFVYNVDAGANVTTLQVFPFRPNKLTDFSAFKMVYSPRTFLRNLFEMLISLQVPYGVCGKQPLLACCIDTCSKKAMYYSNKTVAPRHIQKLATSYVSAGEGCSRRRNKTLSFKLPSRLSQLHKES